MGGVPRILIAEDEPRIASFLQKGFEANGFVTSVVADGMAAAAAEAREPSGRPNPLFRRHSLTGEVEARPNDGATRVGLDPDLHARSSRARYRCPRPPLGGRSPRCVPPGGDHVP